MTHIYILSNNIDISYRKKHDRKTTKRVGKIPIHTVVGRHTFRVNQINWAPESKWSILNFNDFFYCLHSVYARRVPLHRMSDETMTASTSRLHTDFCFSFHCVFLAPIVFVVCHLRTDLPLLPHRSVPNKRYYYYQMHKNPSAGFTLRNLYRSVLTILVDVLVDDNGCQRNVLAMAIIKSTVITVTAMRQ